MRIRRYYKDHLFLSVRSERGAKFARGLGFSYVPYKWQRLHERDTGKCTFCGQGAEHLANNPELITPFLTQTCA